MLNKRKELYAKYVTNADKRDRPASLVKGPEEGNDDGGKFLADTLAAMKGNKKVSALINRQEILSSPDASPNASPTPKRKCLVDGFQPNRFPDIHQFWGEKNEDELDKDSEDIDESTAANTNTNRQYSPLMTRKQEKNVCGRVRRSRFSVSATDLTDLTSQDHENHDYREYHSLDNLHKAGEEGGEKRLKSLLSSSGDVRKKSSERKFVKFSDEMEGSHMDRYLARTQGEPAVRSTSDEDEVDESLYVDERGVKIERSGGKEEIVKPTDSISSIKNKFGSTTNSSSWKKNTEANAEVDASTVSSARNMFKEGETRKADSPSLNRPSKKVRDPKQIMEMRKQLTYANEEEIPQDGTIKKSQLEEIDTSSKHRALDVYKNLENQKQDNELKLQKPRTKLVTDSEAQATMEGIRSVSSSASEAGSDVNDTGIDLTVDTASGYGSAAPCSPSSTYSEDYLSDHKENSSPRDDDLKDVSLDSDIPLVHSPTQQVAVSM